MLGAPPCTRGDGFPRSQGWPLSSQVVSVIMRRSGRCLPGSQPLRTGAWQLPLGLGVILDELLLLNPVAEAKTSDVHELVHVQMATSVTC
jgi:hypothetical protein